jgi:hypothetical protein
MAIFLTNFPSVRFARPALKWGWLLSRVSGTQPRAMSEDPSLLRYVALWIGTYKLTLCEKCLVPVYAIKQEKWTPAELTRKTLSESLKSPNALRVKTDFDDVIMTCKKM